MENKLRWHNVFTGIGQTVGNYNAPSLGDIGWSPNGILYGCDLGGVLYNLNHNTGNASVVASLDWNQPNSMVCDADGMIYIAETSAPHRVIKYNPITGAETIIVDGTLPYKASGDLVFIDETLYLLANIIGDPGLLEIDITTGIFIHIPITGFSGSPWGIANNALGQLFASVDNTFYELNPTTGQAVLTSTANINAAMRGLSMLGDFCQSETDSLIVFTVGETIPCENDLGNISLTIETNLDNLEYNWEAIPSGFPFGFGDFPINANPYIFTINDLPTGNYSITLTNGINSENTIIVTQEITFLYPNDTFNIMETTCSINDSGIFEAVFQNQNGCDSLVITEVVYIPPITNFINLTSCNHDDTGVFTNNYVSQFGCDSTEIITIEFSLSDTTLFTNFSCSPSDTGTVIHSFINQFGCDSLIFTATELIYLEAELIPQPITCFGFENGIIEIGNVSGGLSPYLFSIDGINFQQTPVFQNLSEGQYEIRIQNLNGCEQSFLTYIDAPSQLQVELGEDIEIQLGDSIQIQTTVNQPNISIFIWSPEHSLGNPLDLSPFAKPIETTTYEITVFANDDCFATDEITIFVDTNRGIYIPNAFSPNGDGLNDKIVIFANQGIEQVDEFMIFDRWGEMLFEASNFQPNDARFGWDGRLDGKTMKPAVFVYLAKVRYLDGRVEMFKGDFVLVK